MQVQYKATIGLLLAFTFSTASLLPAQPAAGAAGNAEEPKSTGSDKPPSPDSEAETNRHNVKLRPISESQQQANEDTADAVNRIPGTQVESKDLQPPAPEEPIHGFHPIKNVSDALLARAPCHTIRDANLLADVSPVHGTRLPPWGF